MARGGSGPSIDTRPRVRIAKLKARDVPGICKIQVILECLGLEESLPLLEEEPIARMALLQEDMYDVINQQNLSSLGKLDFLFHAILHDMLPTHHLKEVVAVVWGWLPLDTLVTLRGKAQTLIPSHDDILTAARERDVGAAPTALEKHLANFAHLISCALPWDDSEPKSAEVIGLRR